MKMTDGYVDKQVVPKKKSQLLKDIKKGWQLYVIFSLPLLYILVFKYFPMYGAIIAFKDFNPSLGIWGSPWAGLEHITTFMQSFEFWRVMKNTILLGIYQVLATFPLPIVLALSLTYIYNKRFKRAAQMITYAPHFISVVVMVGIIFIILDPRGPANSLLNALGFDSINFMGEASLFKSIFVWTDVWQNVGFGCIIYLAALAGISPELHEAAIIDGASKLKRIWHIDIPGILPTAIIILILNMGGFLDTGFEKVLLMQNPLNLKASEVIDTYVYKVGLTGMVPQYSYSAAIGLFKAVVGLILIVGSNQLAKKVTKQGLW
ncbi:ABC transporter permease [Gracilibacillus alcaliphilus]|uniref:ABC transporter permease n=1 Tax=Gracilibacillus alcaliphilus TaxID=1401441 RepID=UPI001EF87DCE|nr:ABC transporter permease subunit [Gracilibacillus alcaliphilus]MBM7677462.1 multiple sugar transport system permease protein/putative aldouronate transport system permease protein [Gracilibacillus alcaliphilus]